MSKIVTIVQTRLGSSRLPGKVLMPILDKPLLYRMMERLMRSSMCGTVVIATTTNPSDDPIVEICKEHDWPCYRGSEHDLLDRHYQVGCLYEADIVLKIPSDCPLIDPIIVDNVISYFKGGDFDYVSNLHPPSYPDGNDVEVIRMISIEKAWKEATKLFEREHTTPYIWENNGTFKTGNYYWETGKDYSMSHRFTIDYKDDYDFICRIFEELYPGNHAFSLDDILRLLDKKPEIYEINQHLAGVNWYRNHLDELKTIDASQTKILA